MPETSFLSAGHDDIKQTSGLVHVAQLFEHGRQVIDPAIA
jgi:hypothetical protein